jgi:hypothetical protein
MATTERAASDLLESVLMAIFFANVELVHPLPAAAEDDLGMDIQITGNIATQRLVAGCTKRLVVHEESWMAYSDEPIALAAICAGRSALADWTRCKRCTPHLSLWKAVTLSRKRLRITLAGRMMIYPSAPKLSLTDSVTLSRKRLRITLAGRTRHDGLGPARLAERLFE